MSKPYQAIKCRNGGRRNAFFNGLSERDKKIFWKGYDRGYRIGSARHEVARLQARIHFLQDTIRKLTGNLGV